jgi:ADP-ribose pyrophosphatase
MAPMAERTISSRRAFDGKLIRVRVDEVELESGRRSTREVVEHPGAVAILVWDGERLAMVRQWRQPAGRDLLEVPAGTLDPGEAPHATAVRELAEECGLAAARWDEGPRFYTAPGFCTELMHVWLATELTDAPSLGDPDEELTLEWVALRDAVRAIDEGAILDAKSIAAILWLARELAVEG